MHTPPLVEPSSTGVDFLPFQTRTSSPITLASDRTGSFDFGTISTNPAVRAPSLLVDANTFGSQRAITRRLDYANLENAPRPPRIPHHPAGDIEYGAYRRVAVSGGSAMQVELPSSKAIAKLHRRAANRDLTFGIPRGNPVLANARLLLKETLKIMNDDAVSDVESNLIPTTYGPRFTESAAQNLADDLLLDVNLCFEEELQRALEHDNYFLDAVKQIVGVIHEKLDIKSVAGLYKSGVPLTPEAKKERERYIVWKLEEVFPSDVLGPFLKEDKWTDKAVAQLVARLPTDLLSSDRQYAVDLVKLLKQLRTQVPYFGGSVEYQLHIENSLEFWLYHLSTLTRDPDRQYSVDDPLYGMLSKRLMDYRTVLGGGIPFRNQRNLGTGIDETLWDEMARALNRLISKKLKQYQSFVRREGDNINPGSAPKLWEAYRRIANDLPADDRNVRKVTSEAGTPLNPGNENEEVDLDLREFTITARQLWAGCNEDERKAIYSDMCRIPWSDAHLLHGGEGFEHTLSTGALVPGIRHRLPVRTDSWGSQKLGLMNVIGILANILEKPEVAGRKYMEEKGGFGERLEALRASGHFADDPGAPVDQTILENFVSLHQEWLDNALRSHKPIVGGTSGHTLGYMNMYAEALEKCTEEERARLPSMDTLIAIMIAGLAGAKRHHGVDEIYTASTSVDAPTGRPQYRHRETYADVFLSSDPRVVRCAEAALEATLSHYEKYERTVLSVMRSRFRNASAPDAATRTRLETNIREYICHIGDVDADKVSRRKLAVLRAVRPYIPPVRDYSVRPGSILDRTIDKLRPAANRETIAAKRAIEDRNQRSTLLHLGRGANPNAPLKNPLTALMVGRNTKPPQTLVHKAAEAGVPAQIMRRVLEHGGDPNVAASTHRYNASRPHVERLGDRPLHTAARSLNEEAARALIAAGGDPRLRNKAGQTALDVAKAQMKVAAAADRAAVRLGQEPTEVEKVRSVIEVLTKGDPPAASKAVPATPATARRPWQLFRGRWW